MKPKVLFIYDMEPELVPFWKDGLWAALEILKADKDIDIELYNLADDKPFNNLDAIFMLGWGAFGSNVDKFLRHESFKKTGWGPEKPGKLGLCIGGNAMPPERAEEYDILFYETNWYKKQIEQHPNIVHAFGINANIYKPDSVSRYAESYPIWDYLSVGAFANWKRQNLLCQKPGRKMAIGQIQKGNIQESIDIIGDLLLGGVGISDMVPPEDLVKYYYMAGKVYIPADINGGGERAVLEARACERKVEIENDNPKLKELLTSPIWDHEYYAFQLKTGILNCLNK
jgi:hypothetical protein